MEAQMEQLQKDDSSWEIFCDDWKVQCENNNEDFNDYAFGTFAVLRDLIDNPENNSGVFAVKANGSYVSVCQINVASLPNYPSPVLRVRYLTLSPDFDFGAKTVDEYADALVCSLIGVIAVSDSDGVFNAKNIKFHLRSPSDQPFFKALGKGLNETDSFTSVQTVGAWLYITKS